MAIAPKSAARDAEPEPIRRIGRALRRHAGLEGDPTTSRQSVKAERRYP